MKWLSLSLTMMFLIVSISHLSASQPELKLRYGSPALNWMTSALPIGNGEFGGMFFGGVNSEKLQFNDKSLWSGSTTVRGAYQSFGNLVLTFPDHLQYTGYSRELSLDSAIGKVQYTANGILYQREYFASNPDSVMVVRLTAPGKTGKISVNISLQDAHSTTPVYTANTIEFKGSASNITSSTSTSSILSYSAQAVVLNDGGTLTTASGQISIVNANTVTIILAGGTNFDLSKSTYYSGTVANVSSKIARRISDAKAKTYEQLKSAHVADYKSYFDRVKLDLNVQMPNVYTSDLIKSYKDNAYLDILYYQYGRYLMLGSSRGMSLPSNLQGLWNDSNSPAWQCDIHSNINVQMNYWPAENTNLSECHMPFLDYVNYEANKTTGSWKKMASTAISTTTNGEYMAGNYRGWTVRTQSNIFAYSDWNWNRPANAWYCMHLWQHYQYTKDTTYLKEKAFPAMKGACEFWFDRMKTNAAGKLYAPDEWSPEHGNWEDNIAYAQQLIWELFDGTLKAARTIKADSAFTATLAQKFSLLDNGVKVGSWGQIREWTTQTDTQGDTHRHLSHLIALYPGNQISFLKDSVYANAAKTSLISRGDGGTGWSRAWKISCWARLQDGDHAYKLMKAAQNLTTYTSVSMTDGLGGVYENLLDAHPSYQIDGNFGFTAGVTEMLIQSNLGFIYLLPALPNVWQNGSYSGLRAAGNFTVDISWKNLKPLAATIYSGSGDSCFLYFPGIQIATITDNHGVSIPYVVRNNNLIVFSTVKGDNYNVTFNFAQATTVITPYIKVNSGEKVQLSNIEVNAGDTLLLSPESTSSTGTWLWSGPSSFASASREVTFAKIEVAKSGNYIVTQTVNGVKTVQVFNVIVKSNNKTQLNIIVAGDYYIRKKDTQLYWTNTATTTSTSGGTPSFLAKGSGTLTNAQVWTVTLDGGYYKIVSKADSRYINEKGNFGTNAYYQNWNTYNLYSDSIYTAVQITQNSASSGAFFWNFSGSSIVYSTNTDIDETKDLILEFISTTLTGINTPKSQINAIVKSGVKRIIVKSDQQVKMSIYNQLGALVKSGILYGEQSIELNQGIYIVMLRNKSSNFVTKVIVQ